MSEKGNNQRKKDRVILIETSGQHHDLWSIKKKDIDKKSDDFIPEKYLKMCQTNTTPNIYYEKDENYFYVFKKIDMMRKFNEKLENQGQNQIKEEFVGLKIESEPLDSGQFVLKLTINGIEGGTAEYKKNLISKKSDDNKNHSNWLNAFKSK